MKKIIVTGGSGFIGNNLVDFLIRKKFFVINLDKFTYASYNPNTSIRNKKNYKLIKTDINNKNLILKVLKKYRPRAVFNLAAETHVDRSIDGPSKFIHTNINGTFNLLETLRILRKKKISPKLIHISTDEVYGSIDKGAFSENDTYDPSSPYSASKGSTDLIAISFNRTYSTNIKIVNLTNNYGPYQYPEKFIPTLIFHFLKNIPAPIYGNGKNVREWIYVDDSCNAILKTITSNKKFEKINIGSNNRVSNLEIAKTVFKIMKENNLTILNKNNFLKKVIDRPGHDKRYALNTAFFKKTIGYRMKYNLTIGLKNTIEWYIENKKWLKSTKKSYNFKRLGLL